MSGSLGASQASDRTSDPMEYRLAMKASLTLLSILAPVVLVACASDATNSARPSPTFHSQDKLGELAKPTKVPSVTFAPSAGGQPGTIKFADKLGFEKGVAEGLVVGYRLYEFPVADTVNAIDLLSLAPGDAFQSGEIEVDDMISKQGATWDITDTQTWAIVKPHHVVIAELYESYWGETFVRSFDLRIFNTTMQNGVVVAHFAYEFGPSFAPSGRLLAATVPPARPDRLPSVSFDVAGKATFRGVLSVDPQETPAPGALHMAVYYGFSNSADSKPTSLVSLKTNVTNSIADKSDDSLFSIDVEGQQVDLVAGMTHFWYLCVTEVWTTDMGADPGVNSLAGKLVRYDISTKKAATPVPYYFKQ